MAVQTATVVAASTAVICFRNTGYTDNEVLFTSHNNSADIYIGGSNVTSSSNGIVMPKSSNLIFKVPAGETLYIAGNGSDTIKWLTFV